MQWRNAFLIMNSLSEKQAGYESLPSRLQSGVLGEELGVFSGEDVVGHLLVYECYRDEQGREGAVGGDSLRVPAM